MKITNDILYVGVNDHDVDDRQGKGSSRLA